MTTNNHRECDHPPTKSARAKCRTDRAPYFVHDRASGQCLDLARFNHLNPRYAIVERASNKIIDEAETRYGAKQILSGMS